MGVGLFHVLSEKPEICAARLGFINPAKTQHFTVMSGGEKEIKTRGKHEK